VASSPDAGQLTDPLLLTRVRLKPVLYAAWRLDIDEPPVHEG
jgi:hypothetical protein